MHVCNFLIFDFKTSLQINRPIASRTELFNPMEGSTSENTDLQNWCFNKIISFKKH